MKNMQEGFVIECDKNSLNYLFYYHHLTKNGMQWSHESLFFFEIPREFFIKCCLSLYESFVPLLPCIVDNKIFFSSYNAKTRYLDLFCFYIKTKSIEKVASCFNHIFPPVFIDDKGWSGGSTFPSHIIYL
jgi:hypothetical protein